MIPNSEMTVTKAKQVNVTIYNSWDSTNATMPLLRSTVSLKPPNWFCKTACNLAPFQCVTISIQEFLIWLLPRQSYPGVLKVSLQADHQEPDTCLWAKHSKGHTAW